MIDPQKQYNSSLMAEIFKAIQKLGGWGSVEIVVQDGVVTQISSRQIIKTKHPIET